ncbi:high affinity copper uptake protein 1-like [Centruroides vittatus]|uniref:high affinity copper uptake protein 1-like n=1 Tax=Centruroides vittatus TaxID=120091 RepID=UPI00350F1693
MNIYFSFDYKLNHFLLNGISIATIEEMFGACIMVSLLVFLYETIKIFRNRLSLFLPNEEAYRDVKVPTVTKEKTDWKRVRHHVFQTMLYTVQTFVGYTIMLTVMSFNVWLIVSTLFSTLFCVGFSSVFASYKPTKIHVQCSIQKY